jgi:glycosyltransferase involved in cell wall biosynthesis
VLLPALGELCEVVVGAEDADVCLYHLGNNLLHREAYEMSLARPGVAVLHDAVLHHFYLGMLDRDAYIEEFVYNYGEFQRGQAAALWAARRRSGYDPGYFDYGMLRRVAEAARAVVVHNPAAARIVACHAPRTRVVEVPHLFAAPAPSLAADAARWRAAHGVDPDTFLFGVFGYLRESKRLNTVLRAARRAKASGARIALVVAGEFVSQDLERSVEPLLAEPFVLRQPYCAAPEFGTLTAAVDACVNLRYPSAGETSGIAIRLMGIGKPVLVSAGEENSRFPQDACIRVDTGVAELPMLVEYMVWLAGCPDKAREIGRRAAAYIAEHHSPAQAARGYYEVLSSCCC